MRNTGDLTPLHAEEQKNEIMSDSNVGWLVVLRLNVPVNNFSVMSGRSHRFLGN